MPLKELLVWAELRVMRLETLDEGGGVSDGHRAVVRDGQQLVRRHGESVSVAAVMERADGEVQEVQLPVGQTLPENYETKNKHIKTTDPNGPETNAFP